MAWRREVWPAVGSCDAGPVTDRRDTVDSERSWVTTDRERAIESLERDTCLALLATASGDQTLTVKGISALLHSDWSFA